MFAFFPFAQTVLQESMAYEMDVLAASKPMLAALYACFLLLSTISLRSAVHWVCQIRLPFLHALVYSVVVMFFFYCIGDIFMILFGSRTQPAQAIFVLLLSYIASIALSVFFYGTIIEYKSERTIGVNNGILVFFAQMLANLVLIFIISLPVGIVIGILSMSLGG